MGRSHARAASWCSRSCLLSALLLGLVMLTLGAATPHVDVNNAEASPSSSTAAITGRQLSGLVLGGPVVTGNVGGIPLSFGPFGSLGTPSRESPQRYYKVNCDNPKPTIVLVPGISGSQLDGTQAGGQASCPSFSSPRQIWADITWMKNLDCFAHLLSVQYDPATRKFSNSSGTQMWAYEGGFPDGTDYFIWRTYYNVFWNMMTTKYGFQLGVNLYAAPYDWRLGFKAMIQVGEFDKMARRIKAAVEQNCGQKAVLIGHSMGVNIALRLLREPKLKEWRKKYVRGLINVGGAFAGASATMWETKLSGVLNPYPGLTNLFPVSTLAQLPTFPIEAAVYRFSLGMPAGLLLVPTGEAEGPDHVVVQTPRRSYTIAQQEQLLRDMGDEQSALLLKQTIIANKKLLEPGPIKGVETYCVYGVSVDTPITLKYNSDIAYRQPMRRPAEKVFGPGDGSMGLKTLRLCSRIAPASHLVEVTDKSVDHAGVFSQPAGLAALTGVLEKFMAKPAATGGRPSRQQQQQQPRPGQGRSQAQSGGIKGGKAGVKKGGVGPKVVIEFKG